MPVTPDQPAPYAPASAIMEIVNRHRNKGLPSPVDGDVLGRIGVSDSLIPRTLQALRALDLIEDDGSPSAVFEGIRLAPEAEFKDRLKDWLTGSYAEALQFVDPETATETDVRDAFRSYKPLGQQNRMVSLFINLFREAGVGPERPQKSSSGPKTVRSRRTSNKKPTPDPHRGGSRTGANKDASFTSGKVIQASGMPPALAGLMASLPPSGNGWTQDQRDGFLKAFETVLDYCYPLTEASPFDDEEESEDEFAD